VQVALLASLAPLVVACAGGATTPAPSLESRDLVVAALHDTAALTAARAAVQVVVREGSGREYTLTLEGPVDVADRELDVTARLEQSPAVASASHLRLIVVAGDAYATTADGRWTYVSEGNAMRGIPTTAQVAGQIVAAVEDPATSVRPEGQESCGDRTCARVRVEVPASVAWKALMGIVHAAQPARPGPGQTSFSPTLEPLPSDFPGFAIDVWIDPQTRHLVRATNSTVFGSTKVSVSIALSAHDAPVSIVAPSVAPPPTPPR
jgi:hypothetical protein